MLRKQHSLSRRSLLQLTGATTLGVLAGCAGQLPGSDDGGSREVTPRSTVAAEPDTSFSLTAGPRCFGESLENRPCAIRRDRRRPNVLFERQGGELEIGPLEDATVVGNPAEPIGGTAD